MTLQGAFVLGVAHVNGPVIVAAAQEDASRRFVQSSHALDLLLFKLGDESDLAAVKHHCKEQTLASAARRLRALRYRRLETTARQISAAELPSTSRQQCMAPVLTPSNAIASFNVGRYACQIEGRTKTCEGRWPGSLWGVAQKLWLDALNPEAFALPHTLEWTGPGLPCVERRRGCARRLVVAKMLPSALRRCRRSAVMSDLEGHVQHRNRAYPRAFVRHHD